MPTLDHNSLKAVYGRIEPESQNSRGNAYQSMFRAWLVASQSLTKADFDQGEFVPIFLFLQDAPVILTVRSYYVGDTGTYTLPEIDFDEYQLFPSGEALMVADILTADKVNFRVGEVMTGRTVTNGVEVQGYGVGVNIRNRGIEIEEEDATCKLNMIALCKGAVMDGPTPLTFAVAPYLEIVEPVILAEVDYTQAMRDAGNRIDIAGPGGLVVSYPICGLWATMSLPE
jgi:hypothetical protein